VILILCSAPIISSSFSWSLFVVLVPCFCFPVLYLPLLSRLMFLRPLYLISLVYFSTYLLTSTHSFLYLFYTHTHSAPHTHMRTVTLSSTLLVRLLLLLCSFFFRCFFLFSCARAITVPHVILYVNLDIPSLPPSLPPSLSTTSLHHHFLHIFSQGLHRACHLHHSFRSRRCLLRSLHRRV